MTAETPPCHNFLSVWCSLAPADAVSDHCSLPSSADTAVLSQSLPLCNCFGIWGGCLEPQFVRTSASERSSRKGCCRSEKECWSLLSPQKLEDRVGSSETGCRQSASQVPIGRWVALWWCLSSLCWPRSKYSWTILMAWMAFGVMKLGEVDPESYPHRAERILPMQLVESGEVINYDASCRITLSATILEAEHSCFSVLKWLPLIFLW